MKYCATAILTVLVFTVAAAGSLSAQETQPRAGILKKILQERRERMQEQMDSGAASEESLKTKGSNESKTHAIGDRNFIVYTPAGRDTKNLPLLIVLHGGTGNAKHIQNYLGMDVLADKHGFVVAYLNGTPASKRMPEMMLAWNAGTCCGQASQNKVDDIGFIKRAIDEMAIIYGIDKSRVYATGHSNGAMMTMRLMCETNLLADATVYSGTIQVQNCLAAQGKHLLNIHGKKDANLTYDGSPSTQGFYKGKSTRSQAESQALFEDGGGTYELLLLEDADHLPQTINAALIKTQGLTLPEKIAKSLNLAP